MVPLSIRRLQGSIHEEAVRAELQRRSRRLALEVDVAGFLFPFAGDLARTFPDALFVLTIRNCFAWLESTYGLILNDPVLRDERAARSYWRDWLAALFPFSKGDYAMPEEAAIESRKLPPVRIAFRHWASANAGVIAAIPRERLLILRTDDLTTSVGALADFCGLEVGQLESKFANASARPRNVLDEVPQDFLVRAAEEESAPLMAEHWGRSWRDLVAAHGHPSAT